MYYRDMGIIFGILGVILFFVIAWAIVNYILRSLSYYTVAKRRGAPNPGLAWVPIVWVWTQGGICDQYDATRGIKRKWRVVLLTLSIIAAAGILIGFILMIAQAASTAVSYYRYYNDFEAMSGMMGAFGDAIMLLSLAGAAGGALVVCQMICQFKFFESCRPNDAVKFLLLSNLVPFAQPICLMCCRNYDLGMPQPQPYFAPQPAPQMYPQQPPANDDQLPPPYNPYQ